MEQKLSDGAKEMIAIHIDELKAIETDKEFVQWIDKIVLTKLITDKIYLEVNK